MIITEQNYKNAMFRAEVRLANAFDKECPNMRLIGHLLHVKHTLRKVKASTDEFCDWLSNQ